MVKRKQLTAKQLALIDEIFAGQLDEQTILDKHKVSKNTYRRWLCDDNFTAEFGRRIDWLNLQGQALIARYASLAAAKLVQLTESESQETARKACLDIISLPKLSDKKTGQPTAPQPVGPQQAERLSEQTASRLLAALAKVKK